MNILITGCNGFLGKELISRFKNTTHVIHATNKKSLDVTNHQHVENFFARNDIDIVLHTAIQGGTRGAVDTFEDFVANISMFSNLQKQADKFKLMINFGSGAEFDRSTPIENADEFELFNNWPGDYYGSAKNLIAREISTYGGNIVNLRVFGCFGIHEKSSRMIKSAMLSCLAEASVAIHQNKKMDYIYVGDLYTILVYYIDNFDKQELPKDLNVCYNQKLTLKNIVNKVRYLTNRNVDVIIENAGLENCYTGNCSKLNELDLDLIGLEGGIKEVLSGYTK
jgi:GDP-L-fucose synthase